MAYFSAQEKRFRFPTETGQDISNFQVVGPTTTEKVISRRKKHGECCKNPSQKIRKIRRVSAHYTCTQDTYFTVSRSGHVDTPSKFPGVYECTVQCSVQSMYTRLNCRILCTRPAAAVKARIDCTSYFAVVRMSLF